MAYRDPLLGELFDAEDEDRAELDRRWQRQAEHDDAAYDAHEDELERRRGERR